ncbi:hypothetical protein GJ496_002762 [Pomphorhynchus laevis]|nr:hypothetical protein GJ496_002762 [Pomphorhynchus laevis]
MCEFKNFIVLGNCSSSTQIVYIMDIVTRNMAVFVKLGGLNIICRCLNRCCSHLKSHQSDDFQVMEELNLLMSIIFVVIQFHRYLDIQYNSKETLYKDLDIMGSLAFIIDFVLKNWYASGVHILKAVTLFWKCILFCIGSMEDHYQIKTNFRAQCGLHPFDQDNPEKIIENILNLDANSITKQPKNMIEEDDKKKLYRLPWKMKVSQHDLRRFLRGAYLKHAGISMMDNVEITAGLPDPVVRSYYKLKQYHYQSLGEYQLDKLEEEMKYPLTAEKYKLVHEPTEFLFKTLRNDLPDLVANLLELFGPTCYQFCRQNCRADTIMMANFGSYEEWSHSPKSRQTSATLDIIRYKMTMSHATTSIILLLLKYFKVNHICQFELLRNHLISNKGTELFIAYFEHSPAALSAQFSTRISQLHDDDRSSLDVSNTTISLNPFIIMTAINVARILNKICKNDNKLSQLVLNDTAVAENFKQWVQLPCIKLRYYLLKLLKIQSRLLGRNWRRANTSLFAAIYRTVRHRFNDDWACGNACDQSLEHCLNINLRIKLQEAIAKEIRLKTLSQRFIDLRYNSNELDTSSYQDDNFNNNAELPCWFKDNIDLWVEDEVINNSIDWDALIKADSHSYLV